MRYRPISSEFFLNNRKRLAALLKPGALALLNANDIMPANADGTLGFRQNSDLFYLTGIEQEETRLVMCPGFPDKKYREILFVREPNEMLEKWEGHKLTQAEARALSGIETVLWLPDFEKWFHHQMVMGGVEHVYLNTNEHYRANVVVQSRDARFIEWCQARYPLHTYQRLAPPLSRLRGTKQPQEVALMQQACDITQKGFERVLGFLKPGVWEYEIEAELIHEFVRHGSRGFAYTPIIAAGANNCVLHYIENNKACQAGQLVLIDAAAEYANYNADLTRTVPVSGRFTKRQKDVYNAVLRVQRAAFDLLRPGVLYFEFQQEIEKIMERELLRLKLLDKTDIKNQRKENPALRRYFYHGTSHMLGLDVHDVGNMHNPVPVGSVWTIEPGIYIREEGFGIRLENNVVIRKDKNFDLMRNIPIEAEEIEERMNAG